MIDRWVHKGHRLGTCLASPDKKHAFLQIPKNASSYWKTYLRPLGWKTSNVKELPEDTCYFTMLRDPVERWLSGISEYFERYHNEELHQPKSSIFFKTIEDLIVVDDHTELQSYFLQPIELQHIQFYKIDNLQGAWKYLENCGYAIPKQSWYLNKINYTDDPVNKDKQDWKIIFKHNIDLNKVKNYYQQHDKIIYERLYS